MLPYRPFGPSPVALLQDLPSGVMEPDAASTSFLPTDASLSDALSTGTDQFSEYKGFSIIVPKEFAYPRKVLKDNQQLAIDRDAVCNVKEATKVDIVGWSSNGYVCVIVNLPPTERARVSNSYGNRPISLVTHNRLVVSGVFLQRPSTAFGLPVDRRNIDLDRLQGKYNDFLDWLDKKNASTPQALVLPLHRETLFTPQYPAPPRRPPREDAFANVTQGGWKRPRNEMVDICKTTTTEPPANLQPFRSSNQQDYQREILISNLKRSFAREPMINFQPWVVMLINYFEPHRRKKYGPYNNQLPSNDSANSYPPWWPREVKYEINRVDRNSLYLVASGLLLHYQNKVTNCREDWADGLPGFFQE